jgi:hypothetical protein
MISCRAPVFHRTGWTFGGWPLDPFRPQDFSAIDGRIEQVIRTGGGRDG